ncbi:hypothetical protein P167DRAFT_187118 [Morchella conica CCBAS932]|uniref:Uncharacterized protein n=1 Tax=Morchella conica CCBAS932 TaxID=1392247 RepID=A0A3N4KR36_9PEZI|nr:hypothetical protein P167DRAFT_187118 [Morchella conica CCBAS932]
MSSGSSRTQICMSCHSLELANRYPSSCCLVIILLDLCCQTRGWPGTTVKSDFDDIHVDIRCMSLIRLPFDTGK